MTTPSGQPPLPDAHEEAGPDATGSQPLPLQLELPGNDRGTVRESSPETGHESLPPSRPFATLFRVLVGLLVFVALAALPAVWALPWYVRQHCVEAAAEHGISLAVAQVKITPEGFRLFDVSATAAALPGMRASAPEVEVSTHNLRPERMTIRDAEIALSGGWDRLAGAFTRWRASPTGGQAGDWAPSSLTVDGAHLLWRNAMGDSVRVEAADLRAQVTWQERGAELHARSDRVTVGVAGTILGPWRVDGDRTVDGSRVRVALDPGVPEACTILVVGDAERTTSIDVVVPRSPLSHLGLPAGLLGFSTNELQTEMTAHYVALGPSRADASARGGVYGVEFAGLPRPIDIAWEGTASGSESTGINIKNARLAVGALVGPVTGTLKGFDDGFRLDLAWAAGPVPCAAFAVSLAQGQPFFVDYQLQKLVEAGITKKIAGTVSASLMLAFDSRVPGATKVDFVPDIACQLP